MLHTAFEDPFQSKDIAYQITYRDITVKMNVSRDQVQIIQFIIIVIIITEEAYDGWISE